MSHEGYAYADSVVLDSAAVLKEAQPFVSTAAMDLGAASQFRVWPALFLALAACAPQTVVKDRIERVNVPVQVNCVSGVVEQTVPLNQRYTPEQWAKLTLRQKVAAVSAQGIRRMNETDRLRASMAGCK